MEVDEGNATGTAEVANVGQAAATNGPSQATFEPPQA